MPSTAKSGDKKSVDVRQVKTSPAKSPKDLEAEIAAAAKSIGEAKTVKSKISPVEAAPPAAKPAKAATSKTQAVVSKRRVKPVTKVAVSSEGKDDKPEVASRAQVLGHRERTIAPVSPTSKVPIVTEEPKPQEAPVEAAPKEEVAPPTVPEAEKQHEVAVEASEPSPPSPTFEDGESNAEVTSVSTDAGSAEAEHKLEEMTKELKSRAHPKSGPDSQQHVAKVYDTKKYHVPIKANRHHRRSAVPFWVEMLILIVGIAAALGYAIYADVVNLDLPFASDTNSSNEEPQPNIDTGAAAESVTEAPVVESGQEVAPSDVKLFGTVAYQNIFNSGNASIEFTQDGKKYALDGAFVVDEVSGSLLLDFLDDEQTKQAETLLSETVTNLGYRVTSPFDESRAVEFLANPEIVGRVTLGSLLGIGQVFSGGQHDMTISYSSDLYDVSTVCTDALSAFLTTYYEFDLTADNTPLLQEYNALNTTCIQDDDSDGGLKAITPQNIPDLVLFSQEVEGSIQIEAKQGEETIIKVTLSQLEQKADASGQKATDTTPEFIATRFIDVVLLGRCDGAAFAQYEQGDDISSLAAESGCALVE